MGIITFYILSVLHVLNSFLSRASAGCWLKIFMAKHVLIRLTLILPLLAVTACGQQTIPSNNASSSAQQTSNNTQNATAMPGQRSENNGFLSAPVVAPPSYDNRPLQPGQSPQAQTLPNGLPALKPLKGVNVDTLFAENITNSDRRFERVENAVKDMRREFETVKPAIVRLVAVEEDIQQMVEQLEAMAARDTRPVTPPAPIVQQPAAPQNLTPTDMQKPAAPAMEPKPKAAPAPASSNGKTVKNLRTGQHSNKVRLVLDMSAKTPYTVDLDSSENILVIELPEAGWSGATSKTFSSKEPLLASYTVEGINNGSGTRIVIPLKKSTSVLKQALLPPGVTPNYRMYVDLSL